MTWPRSIGILVGLGVLAGVAATALATRRWKASTARLVVRLTRTSAGPRAAVPLPALESLPAPVGRFFRTVLPAGRMIRVARITQAGEFRSRESPDVGAGWQPFEATQVFTTDPPGFVWDANIRMAPFTAVRVRDAYVAGGASMRGAALALIPVVDEPDGPELRAGALQRYLAESVWFPTALLPRDGLSWSPMDDTHARATLVDGPTSVSLEFEFGADGTIVGVWTPGRKRAVPGEKGTYVTVPWGGRYGRYVEHGGMLVPLESEVYWVVGGREQPYYRGRNLGIDYDLTEATPDDSGTKEVDHAGSS